MRKLIALLFTSILVFGVVNTSQAGAAKDPPLKLMLASAYAPTAPAVPDSTVSFGAMSGLTTTRLYNMPELSVPNTACWHFSWTKRFVNGAGDTIGYPYFWADICWRNYVVLAGTEWSCGSKPITYFRFEGCDFDWGMYGAATRFTSGNYNFDFGYGWLTLHRDVTLEMTFYPGWFKGTIWENF